MKNFRDELPRMFEAFIKSAQYLVRLQKQQDIWSHLGKFITTYFPADWTAFVRRNAANQLCIHHCSLPDGMARCILTQDVRCVITEVLESGFLASQATISPAPSMTAFLPIVTYGKPEMVLLIGHSSAEALSKELLEVYLAVVGLAGSTSERLNTEMELNRHRAHLEELVQERTAELEQAKRHNELILNSVGEGICGLDLNGNITFINPSAARLIGWQPDQLIGRNAHATFHHTRPQGCPYPEQECPILLALGKKISAYITGEEFVRRDGTRFPVEFMTTSIIEEGNAVGAVMVFRDITERKQAEEALQKLNSTLEQRVAERTALAESRAKQLQTLAVELIEAEERERRRVAQLLHDDLQQLLASAKMQFQAACETLPCDPLLENVQRLLTESIRKSRRLSHELSPVVLHHSGLIAGLRWLSGQMRDQFGLHVQLETDAPQADKMPLKVFVFRAVQELLFNIVKHAGVKNARVVLCTSHDSLIISVIDQGRGFYPDILDAPNAETGFGLLTLRERACYIGGNLTIHSTPGQGSCFTLTIPLRPAKSHEAQPIASSGDQQASTPVKPAELVCPGATRVLFADDHKVMRQGLIQLIANQPDIQVVGEASNGQEAVEQARQLKPDVIVMDVSMPGMDGIEATRRIKAELPNVRVISLSMHEDEYLALSMHQAGAEAFLSKTASSAELLKAIYGITHEQDSPSSTS